MRLLASLLLAAALAAPFGDAGALSLAGTGGCLAGAVAQAEASWDLSGHGLAAGDAPAARPYLPGAGASTVGEGEKGRPNPPSALSSRTERRRGGAPRTLSAPAAAVAVPVLRASLQGFDAHPSTAPPQHS